MLTCLKQDATIISSAVHVEGAAGCAHQVEFVISKFGIVRSDIQYCKRHAELVLSRKKTDSAHGACKAHLTCKADVCVAPAGRLCSGWKPAPATYSEICRTSAWQDVKILRSITVNGTH